MMKYKCPKGNKNCSGGMIIQGAKDNYICSGINSKPTKYKKDNIWLCLRGSLAKQHIEMTLDEALGIISVLSCTLFGMESEKREKEND